MLSKVTKPIDLSITIAGDRNDSQKHSLIAKVKSEGYYVPQVVSQDTDRITRIDGCASSVSFVDAQSKYSREFAQCFGLAAIGQSREVDEHLSFLFHGNPEYFMRKKRELHSVLIDRLRELSDRSSPDSVSVVIFAGETTPYWLAEERMYAGRIDFLSGIIREGAGVIPQIMRPKFSRPFNTEFYLDTPKCQAVLVQPDPVTIKPRDIFSADRVACEQLRWRMLARQVLKEPLSGCYLFQEW